jgi:hypothetical protein
MDVDLKMKSKREYECGHHSSEPHPDTGYSAAAWGGIDGGNWLFADIDVMFNRRQTTDRHEWLKHYSSITLESQNWHQAQFTITYNIHNG